MEVITGWRGGTKSSLVVHIVTKSGLNRAGRLAVVKAGSVTSPTFEANIGGVAVGLATFVDQRYADDRFRHARVHHSHADGNNQSFDRLDFHPNDANTLHLNVQFALV